VIHSIESGLFFFFFFFFSLLHSYEKLKKTCKMSTLTFDLTFAIATRNTRYFISNLREGYRWSLANDSSVSRVFEKQEMWVFMAMGVSLGALGSVCVHPSLLLLSSRRCGCSWRWE
jgi:hypothetical protein